MGRGFDGLSEYQQASFRANVARLGLTPDSMVHEPFTTGPGAAILSSDAKQSKLAPTLIPVRNIAELKTLAGIPDEHYTSGKVSDKAIYYPPPLDEARLSLAVTAVDLCDLQRQLSAEEHEQVRCASEAYMQGRSDKVKGYEPLINALYFPSQIAAFNTDSIVVTAGNPLILSGPNPVAINAASITVEAGGQIIVETHVSIAAQKFDSQ